MVLEKKVMNMTRPGVPNRLNLIWKLHLKILTDCLTVHVSIHTEEFLLFKTAMTEQNMPYQLYYYDCKTIYIYISINNPFT